MGFRVGRYAAEYEWIGDYLEGAEIYGDIKGVRVALEIYRQTYANPAENTRYGYLKNLYEKHQGYTIKITSTLMQISKKRVFRRALICKLFGWPVYR